MTETDWPTKIRDAGLRVTAPRLAVLTALDTSSHASVDEVIESVSAQGEVLSVQSAYNVLTDLVSAGLVRSIELAHQPARFEIDTGDNHHHVVCTRCGRIEDVECAVGSAPCLTPANDHGMSVWKADVLYRGLCADCQSANN